MPRGLSRHDVVFVAYDKRVYALKELPVAIGEREYDLLRELEERGLPAVVAVGHAHRRADGATRRPACCITRFLEASVPYRTLFMQQGLDRYRERLLDAMAGLLVRLHLAGFVWGDCSLSNTLFRRDAGELQAYLVDAETSELHETISDGRRAYDLDVMEENVAGELPDLGTWSRCRRRCRSRRRARRSAPPLHAAVDEITREVLLKPDERFRIHERIRALNDLGFTVGEMELLPAPDGEHLRLRTIVTDRDHHRHLLHSMTGVVAGDPAGGAVPQRDPRDAGHAGAREEPQCADERGCVRLAQGALRAHGRAPVDPVRGPGADAAELYAEVLEHKWFRSEQAQHDVGLETAIEDRLARPRSFPCSGASRPRRSTCLHVPVAPPRPPHRASSSSTARAVSPQAAILLRAWETALFGAPVVGTLAARLGRAPALAYYADVRHGAACRRAVRAPLQGVGGDLPPRPRRGTSPPDSRPRSPPAARGARSSPGCRRGCASR